MLINVFCVCGEVCKNRRGLKIHQVLEVCKVPGSSWSHSTVQRNTLQAPCHGKSEHWQAKWAAANRESSSSLTRMWICSLKPQPGMMQSEARVDVDHRCQHAHWEVWHVGATGDKTIISQLRQELKSPWKQYKREPEEDKEEAHRPPHIQWWDRESQKASGIHGKPLQLYRETEWA